MSVDRYAVFGNPVAHSKSPQIHQHFARQEGVEIEYDRILAPLDGFAAAAQAWFDSGAKGANVTVPFKLDAYEWVSERSERAETAGAVNTLIPLGGGRFRGDNTDGVGLVLDITENHGIALQGKKILLLGAGGAARGVVKPLLEQKPDSIIIANRTEATAHELAQRFGIEAAAFDSLPERHFDIIINATSGSLSGDVSPVSAGVLAGAELVYDMMYGDEPTPFLQFAQAAGAQNLADGLGMLVAQAAFSYSLLRGFMPDIRPVVGLVREGK